MGLVIGAIFIYAVCVLFAHPVLFVISYTLRVIVKVLKILLPCFHFPNWDGDLMRSLRDRELPRTYRDTLLYYAQSAAYLYISSIPSKIIFILALIHERTAFWAGDTCQIREVPNIDCDMGRKLLISGAVSLIVDCILALSIPCWKRTENLTKAFSDGFQSSFQLLVIFLGAQTVPVLFFHMFQEDRDIQTLSVVGTLALTAAVLAGISVFEANRKPTQALAVKPSPMVYSLLVVIQIIWLSAFIYSPEHAIWYPALTIPASVIAMALWLISAKKTLAIVANGPQQPMVEL